MGISDGYKAIKVWASASGADKTAPDDSTLTPSITVADGWPDTFSAANGSRPRRAVFNWLFNAITSALVDIRNQGILAYDSNVDTLANGIRQHGGKLYRATANVGPSYNNAAAPGSSTLWAEITGTLSTPSAPSAPTATAGNGQLSWTWNCPLDGGAEITAFEFQWRAGTSGAWTAEPTITMAPAIISGLTNGTAYQARVRATNSQGTSGWSPTGTGTPAGTVPGGGNALGLRSTAGNGSVDLSWFMPPTGGLSITNYTLQWRSGSQDWATSRQQTETGTTATVSSLSNGTAYTFRVRATNSAGSGEWSNLETATPTAPVVLQAIPDVAAAPIAIADGSAALAWTWNAPSDNGADITSYQVRYRQGTSGNWTSANTTQPYLRITGLTGGQSYQAQVRATNSVGQQTTWSPTGTGTAVTAPGAPTLYVTAASAPGGNTTITYSWSAGSTGGGDITGWELATYDTFDLVNTYPAATTSVTIPGFSGGSYKGQVRAINAAGYSPWSATQSG